MSLYTSSMNSSESNRYRLRMWVDEDYNPQGDGGNLEFSLKINVYGKDGLSMEDRMMMGYDSSNPSDFHTDEYKSKITSIVTKGDTVISEGVIESWDISEKQNGSVIAYAEDDGTGAGTYKVTIGGEGKIIANYDMSSYFSGFSNITSINLMYLDTSITTNMSRLFFQSSNLKEIMLDSLETSKVTNMSYMFTQNKYLFELNLSNFDTSNVTDMGYMFYVCSSLTNLDLNNFDTSNVTNMAMMFSMDLMTADYMKLDNIIFSKKFSTSKVTNMMSMFFGCSSLKKLDLSNFDTSNVTNFFDMFAKNTNMTEILVTRNTWTIPNSAIRDSGVTDFTYV